MLLLENLPSHTNPFPNSSHASCLKQGWAWKRSSYLTETKFLVLTFSSRNIFNFLLFTLIHLSKVVMWKQDKPLQQRWSRAKAPHRTELYSWSKSVQKLLAKLHWLCQGSCDGSDFCWPKLLLPFGREHLPRLSWQQQTWAPACPLGDRTCKAIKMGHPTMFSVELQSLPGGKKKWL